MLYKTFFYFLTFLFLFISWNATQHNITITQRNKEGIIPPHVIFMHLICLVLKIHFDLSHGLLVIQQGQKCNFVFFSLYIIVAVLVTNKTQPRGKFNIVINGLGFSGIGLSRSKLVKSFAREGYPADHFSKKVYKRKNQQDNIV